MKCRKRRQQETTMKTYIKMLREPVKEGEKSDKLGPQETACMNSIAKCTGGAGKQALRTDVIKHLSESGELVTKQDPARILSFYQPKFKDKGLIEIVKEADAKPEKPKADPKTAAAPAGAAKGTAPGATGAKPVAATTAAG
jgi:hypothetical protein